MSSGEADALKPNMRQQGLAAESVPYRHETKDYWYTRYFAAKEHLEKMIEHHNELEFSGACAWPCDIDQDAKEFLRNEFQTTQA